MNKTLQDVAGNLSKQGFEYMNYIQLLTALHDAINSPKGVVPESAERFYCVSYYNESLLDIIEHGKGFNAFNRGLSELTGKSDSYIQGYGAAQIEYAKSNKAL